MSSNDNNWIKIFTSSDPMEAAIMKGILNDHEIAVVEMNKQDTAYVAIGEIDLLVPEENYEAARIILMNTEQDKA